MGFMERKTLYEHIETTRDHPLIAYVTSSRTNAHAQMAPDVIPRIAEQVRLVPREYDAVDLLMPVDMQLTQRRRVHGPDGHPTGEVEEITFGSEDVRHFLEFLRADVGITDQGPLEKAFELAIRDVGAIAVGSAKRGTNLALSMGEKLLGLHMDDKNQAKAIAESFNSAFYHHGYPVGRREAADAGLNVVRAEDLGLDDDLWSIWTDVADEMAMASPFDPIIEVMNDSVVGPQLASVSGVTIPAGLPPAVAQQAYQQALSQIQIAPMPAVDYDLFMATVESPRCRSEFRQTGKLNATRLPDMSIQVAAVQTSVGWQSKDVAADLGGQPAQESA